MSSQDDTYGFHEEWECNNSDGHNHELEAYKKRVEVLEEQLQHCKWHNAVYRTALRAVEGGLSAAQDQIKRARQESEPLCMECEKDYLLKILHEKEEMIEKMKNNTSPVLCSTSKKRCRRPTF